ncbi:Bgt-4485-2 [Blumeria graminis f. sp. tritici]|uniref:Bgt-4485-2 n=2 Tax=Blumeria graminis f. sp. tritici TaxID=62690 RepID=A0A061HDX2_BLUGR|nr:hypothetical protein BGT96224_4485B [Blumeria graminis f. sp. tritici 96224]VDB93080.1 Bgt-4485-2 [Blumeria graminis f. sp. tritici]
MNPENRMMLPAIAFASFTKRYQAPQMEEGFQDIVEINFNVPSIPELNTRSELISFVASWVRNGTEDLEPLLDLIPTLAQR